jgi:hypothetical protein
MVIEIHENWDKTFNLIIDGQLALERRTRTECEQRALYVETFYQIDGVINSVDKPTGV